MAWEVDFSFVERTWGDFASDDAKDAEEAEAQARDWIMKVHPEAEDIEIEMVRYVS